MKELPRPGPLPLVKRTSSVVTGCSEVTPLAGNSGLSCARAPNPAEAKAVHSAAIFARRARWGFAIEGARPGRSAEMRQVVRQLDELRVVDRLQYLQHDRLVGV